jgi:hypothetical protein
MITINVGDVVQNKNLSDIRWRLAENGWINITTGNLDYRNGFGGRPVIISDGWEVVVPPKATEFQDLYTKLSAE